MKVTLVARSHLELPYSPVEGLTECDSIIAHAVAKCYRIQPNNGAIKRCLDSGHHSVFEHLSFTFEIQGISRACLAQLTRHRHASFTVESQRYVNYLKKRPKWVYPDAIINNLETMEVFADALCSGYKAHMTLIEQGCKPEDARAVLPQAIGTNLTMTMDARELIDTFFPQRLDKHAQAEIRQLAGKMLGLVHPLAPVTFSNCS